MDKNTKEEIIEKYLSGISANQICIEKSINISSVMYLLRKNNIPIRSISENVNNYYTKKKNCIINFDEELNDILLGNLLGDGSIRLSMVNCIYTHTDKHLEYVEWIKDIFNLRERRSTTIISKSYRDYGIVWSITKVIVNTTDGCRENQVLTTDATYAEKDAKHKPKYDYIQPRDKDDLGETYGSNVKRRVACGNLYINICRDSEGDLVETFINTGKGGICQSNTNAISRLVSLALRSGVKVDSIIDQLSNIKCPACTILKAQGKEVEQSCPDAIARYLKEKYEQGNIVIKETKSKSKKPIEKDNKMICPNCGEKMRLESGCITCTCGFSKCG